MIERQFMENRIQNISNREQLGKLHRYDFSKACSQKSEKRGRFLFHFRDLEIRSKT